MKQAEKEQDSSGISFERGLEELISELQGYRQGSIKCATVHRSKYGTLDNLMCAMKEHPFEDKDIKTEHLQEMGVIPLINYKDRHIFGLRYMEANTNQVRAPGEVIINLEDRLFIYKKFKLYNIRFVLLGNEEYETLTKVLRGEIIEQPKKQTTTEPARPMEDIDRISQIFYGIVSRAISERATDIHFERLSRDETRIRFRIDGKLVTFDDSMRADVFQRVVASTKTIAQVKSYDPYEPQDGSITFKEDVLSRYDKLKGYSLRLSTVPIMYDAGEKVVDKLVLRILESQKSNRSLEDLGFPHGMCNQIYDIVSASQGMMLVTGPTGSGKTTTLYAILQYLNTGDRNVITVEEPIEAFIKGLNQSEVNKARKWTFDRVMRHYLRQDPNVILVGETRDDETANLLFRAAETGHYVLSTLHTNSTVESLSRLDSFGIKPTYIISSLSAILSQRLAKLLCPDCRVEYDGGEHINALLREEIVKVPLTLCQPPIGVNCQRCHGTGYYGRTAVPELWVVDEDARDLIIKGALPSELKRAAMKNGMKTLMQHGMELVLQGKTSLQEIVTFARSGFYNEKEYVRPIIGSCIESYVRV